MPFSAKLWQDIINNLLKGKVVGRNQHFSGVENAIWVNQQFELLYPFLGLFHVSCAYGFQFSKIYYIFSYNSIDSTIH